MIPPTYMRVRVPSSQKRAHIRARMKTETAVFDCNALACC